MNRISLCMIVRNEADTVARCLQSAAGAVDEILVVDTGSTDDTVAICESFGAQVRSVTWENDFAAARNCSLKRAAGEWILVLDADDELPRSAHPELRALAEDENHDAFFMTTKSLVGDVRHPAILKSSQMRLFRNQPRFRYVGAIHETIPKLPDVRYGMAPIFIIHRGYLDTLVQNRRKIERNVSILSSEIQRRPFDPSLHYYLGNERLRAGAPLSAIHHYGQAMTLLKKSDTQYWLPDLPTKYAYALWQTDNAESAIEAVRQAISETAAYTDAWFLLGSLCLDQHRFDEARKAFQECLRLGDPPPVFPAQEGAGTYLPAFFLGVMALEEKDAVSAKMFFERSWKGDPNYVPALTQLCLCDWIDEDFATVRRRLESIEQRQADDPAWEVMHLINESFATKQMKIRTDDPAHTSSLLTCLSTLMSFGRVALSGQIMCQLPSGVRHAVLHEEWYFELSARYWLAASRVLEA